MAIDPPYEEIFDAGRAWVDKATLRDIKGQTSGKYLGAPVTSTFDTAYQGSSKYPLKVGKEVTITATTTMTTTVSGESETETEVDTYTFRVERIEDITVPAGTFRCFKIVEYDEHGTVSDEEWYADEPKINVKSIDHETGEIMELKSYSVR